MVSSFNTRTGAVVLGSTDVTSALTFTPYNASNPSGYQTSANVVSAIAAGNPGAFSTLSASSTITPSQTAGIVGTTTTNNANAGAVGEYVSSTVLVGSPVSLSAGVAANVTSISLTAGDWDVTGTIGTNPAGTTTTSYVYGAITTASGTIPTTPDGVASIGAAAPAGFGHRLAIAPMRLSLSATTTVYLVAQVGFAVSTLSTYGIIGARRRR